MLAVTTVHPGEVLGDERALAEADVEVRSIDRDWRRESGALFAVMLHEIGHVLGLDDPCAASWLGTAGGKTRCREVAPAVAASSVMYYVADYAANTTRDIGPADAAFLRVVYPVRRAQ